MKKYLVPLLASAFLFIACDKSNHCESELRKGTYKGIFKRFNQENSLESEVTLQIDSRNFSGTSTISKYPAIGSGKIDTEEGTLIFNDRNAWTADFDWTLILDGTYLDNSHDDSLIFTRSYANGWVDVYRLKKAGL